MDYVDHNKLWKILKEMGIPDHLTCLLGAFLVAQRLKHLPAMQETQVRSLDWEDHEQLHLLTLTCLLKVKVKVKVKSLSRVQLFATPWTVAYQDPPSMGFSRQECWSGLPFPSPGDLPDPGIKPESPALQTDALLSEPPGKPQ